MRFTGIGVWTAQFDFQPAAAVVEAVHELEELGYGSVWLGENVGREPISQSTILLGATTRLIIATGVANIWARDPLSALAAQQTISEAYPDRFILGLGVSHTKLVNDIRRHDYRHPLQAMTDYLTAMDQAAGRYRAVPAQRTTRMLGALGPRMTRLARAMTDGVHTYLVPPEHTAATRELLGPDKLLVTEQAVVFERSRTRAHEVGRRHLRRYLSLVNYTDNLLRLGLTPDDFTDNGSDRLIDALITWGDEHAIAARINQHRQAGADHVCIQLLDHDSRALPRSQWHRLASLTTT